MILVRSGDSRGGFRNDWLDARFSFSFGDWVDPHFERWSDLVAFNEDIVAPGGGFAEHPHADVEVMSYPLSGVVEHRDSLGNVARLARGDVHLMRAGRGIRHSEMNVSRHQAERHLQWWIRPARRGLEPGYWRLRLDADALIDRERVLAAPDGAGDSLPLAQDARVFVRRIESQVWRAPLAATRKAFLHVVAGHVCFGAQLLQAGDEAFVHGEAMPPIAPAGGGEVLLFDLRGDD